MSEFLIALPNDNSGTRWAEVIFNIIKHLRFNLLDLFKMRMSDNPAKNLFLEIEGSKTRTWTCKQIHKLTRNIAGILYHLAGGNHKVAIFSDNMLKSASIDLACLFYCILDTPLNIHFRED